MNEEALTINCTPLVTEHCVNRLFLIYVKVRNRQDIVTCTRTDVRNKTSAIAVPLVFFANSRPESTRCFTPTHSSTSLAPMHERSKIPGKTNVTAETRTSFVPRTVRVSPWAGETAGRDLRAYATPVARFSLYTLYSLSRETCQSQNALVGRNVLHMYSHQEVQVRPGILEQVDNGVRHIQVGARLSVHLSTPQEYKCQYSQRCILEIMYALRPPLPPAHHVTQLSIKQNSRARDSYRVHVDRFQIIRVRVIRLLRTVPIECTRNLKELPSEVREKPPWRDRKRTVCAVSRPPTGTSRPTISQFQTQWSTNLLPYAPFSGAG